MKRDPNPNRLNIYTCHECGEHIVSKDVDEGVTPFIIQCQFGCHGRMYSSFYRVFDPEGKMKWTHEWYRPTIFPPHMTEHVAKGGLMLRAKRGHSVDAYRIYQHGDHVFRFVGDAREDLVILQNTTGEFIVVPAVVFSKEYTLCTR